MLLLLSGQSATVDAEVPAQTTGYSPRKKPRYYAEIGGMRFLFPTEEARRRAVEAASPKEAVAEVIKKATVRAPVVEAKPVQETPPPVVEPEHDDEEDIEMLLLAL